MTSPAATAPIFGPATVDDLDTLVAIDTDSPQAWDRAAFAEELRHHPPTVFVMRLEGQAVAFMAIRLQEQDLDIVNVAVTPSQRRRGFGRLMVEKVVSEARGMGAETAFLEVRESNHGARALYRDLGFEETQKRRAFYRNPVEDAVLMRLSIGPERG